MERSRGASRTANPASRANPIRTPRTIPGALLAVEALKILEERKISSLIVVDDDGRVRGVLHLHDLWRTEMF